LRRHNGGKKRILRRRNGGKKRILRRRNGGKVTATQWYLEEAYQRKTIKFLVTKKIHLNKKKLKKKSKIRRKV
jgi:hypothetical protein